MNTIFQKYFMGLRAADKPKQQGYITLLSVLMIGAVGTVIVVSLLLLGLSSSRTSFALQQSKQASGLADACAEEALMKITESAAFTGSATMTLGSGSCSYTVTNTSGQTRTITTQGTVATSIRKVSITIDKVSPISIVTWQEIP